LENLRSLGRNTLYSGLSAASNALLVVLVVLAANVLGDRAFGEFSFALAIASIFEMLVDLGLNTLVARNVARDRGLAARYLPSILSWKILLSLAAMGLLVLTVWLLQRDSQARIAAFILGVGIVLRSFKSTSQAFFQSHERFDLMLLTTYIERALVLGLGIAVLYTVGGLIPFCIVFVLARVPDLAISFWLVNSRIAKVRLAADWALVRRMQRDALPFASYSLITVLYVFIGTVILGAVRSSEEVGWYNAGYKIYEGLTMFPAFVAAAVLPRLSRLFVTDRGLHAGLSVRTVRYLSMISFPIVIVSGYMAPWVIRLLFGTDYLPAVTPLHILLGATVLMFTNVMLNTILISADQQAVVVRVAAAGLAVMTCSNLLLAARFGIVGAAACVAVSEACVLMMLLLAASRQLFSIRLHLHVWKPVLACVVSLLAVRALGLSPLSSAALFAALYVAGMSAMRPFSPGEWAELRSVFLPGSAKE